MPSVSFPENRGQAAAYAKDTPPGLLEIGYLAYGWALISAPYSKRATGETEWNKAIAGVTLRPSARFPDHGEGGELSLTHPSTVVAALTLARHVGRRSDDSTSTPTLHTAGVTTEKEDL